MLNVIKKVIKALWAIPCWLLFRLIKIKDNKIVVSNYYGRGYGDNPKYIVEELLKKKRAFEIIWIIKNSKEKELLPQGIKTCNLNSVASIFHLSTAKVWIDNCRKGFVMFKRKTQLYIQTWHGGGAQKRCEKDVENVLAPIYVKRAKQDSKKTDLMISESRFMTDLYHRSFWYAGPVYECGYPRYDIILQPDEHLISKVYKYFDIERSKELVLYAPTFRVDHSFKAYDIDFERLRINLKKRFGKEFVILVHLHPNVATVEGGIEYDGETVINSTFYPDTQELVAASSVLIGDYSSINYDFSLKRLPVFRYVSDLEEYRNDRDLYFPFDEYPYPYAQNNDELESLILNFDDGQYLKKLNAFFQILGATANPSSSEQIAELIIDFLHQKDKSEFFNKNKEKFIYRNEVLQ